MAGNVDVYEAGDDHGPTYCTPPGGFPDPMMGGVFMLTGGNACVKRRRCPRAAPRDSSAAEKVRGDIDAREGDLPHRANLSRLKVGRAIVRLGALDNVSHYAIRRAV